MPPEPQRKWEAITACTIAVCTTVVLIVYIIWG